MTTEISLIRSDQEILRKTRDPIKAYAAVKQALVEKKFGTKAEAKRLLEEVGLRGISPLWKLPLFRKHFFQRFAQCRLHLILLGHVLKVFEFLGLVYGWEWVLKSFFFC